MPPLVVDSVHSLKDLVGQEIPPTDWFLLTQDRISSFARITEDTQWIHLEPERARRESPYGTTIAHGFLTLSLLSYFMKQAIQIRPGAGMAVNYGLNRVRFPSPVLSDSKIRARFVAISVKDVGDAIEATFSATIEREHSDKPCCVAEWIVRYYPQVRGSSAGH